MNLIEWNKIYENNKRLDKIFLEKYSNDKRLFDKNCIELMVEIGEFINETKIFKYWSIKKSDKEKVLDEYADIITITLTFFREFDLVINDYDLQIENEDILKLIMNLYYKTYLFYKSKNKKDIEKIFYSILDIGKLLEFEEYEILNAIKNKQKIIEERLNSDY